MQNISFRRKLKHIWKEYQRTKSLQYIRSALLEFGIDTHYLSDDWGYPCGYSSIPYVLNVTRNNPKRFSKLCLRLGKKAKSQGKTICFRDVINCVRQNGDARLIPFKLLNEEKEMYSQSQIAFMKQNPVYS